MPATRRRWAGLTVAALAALPALAAAQKPTKRRQAPIEIRGTVPTPQVVTVRPREVPTYSRQVLVPRFFDHDFWPDIQTGYLMVPERQITGRAVADSLTAGMVDSSGAPMTPMSPATNAAPGTTPPNAAPPNAATPSATPARAGATTSPLAPATNPATTSPATTPDTTRRTPGTASAPPAR